MSLPARNYSWEPFAPGHTKSLTHGAYSPRRADPLATEIIVALLDDPRTPDFLKEPIYRPALWALARTEARIQLIDEWLQEKGHLDEKGKPRPAGESLIRNERLAAEMRSKLGLDPSSQGRIQRDLASAGRDFNLAAAVAEGAKVRAERRSRQETDPAVIDQGGKE